MTNYNRSAPYRCFRSCVLYDIHTTLVSKHASGKLEKVVTNNVWLQRIQSSAEYWKSSKHAYSNLQTIYKTYTHHNSPALDQTGMFTMILSGCIGERTKKDLSKGKILICDLIGDIMSRFYSLYFEELQKRAHLVLHKLANVVDLGNCDLENYYSEIFDQIFSISCAKTTIESADANLNTVDAAMYQMLYKKHKKSEKKINKMNEQVEVLENSLYKANSKIRKLQKKLAKHENKQEFKQQSNIHDAVNLSDYNGPSLTGEDSY